MTLILRPPKTSDEQQLRRLHDQLLLDGFDFLLAEGTWEEILARYTQEAVHPPAGRVVADYLVAEVGGSIVGRSSIRHSLNDYLFERGGHIGYAVGPDYRGRGYAQQILRLSVDRLRSIGVDRVLLTCDEDNSASATVIERCGGVLEDTRLTPEGTAIRRYWIQSSS